ncbi:MAG TPA: competence protein ComE [Cyanobacteria bacterium UBA11149]|nr:competence protein ComE [Cyanobacteria bacterium UBA11367]HBE57797.1 competence protein ComE [Cyanobacteria bacterium UBA11366]HBK65611.1 competence protein ComE [Cyanobacteria bacterium UBA11166]HBR73430.1 competence protein ComE [Cyanobacteria bacterium UBA11159]HBS68372.1 competence protein ComE [Cyanobacteria bacterium UBA11153]HBW87459.1 competence protein ComE [Cyanobacteria bacterium UBA11149]HCA93854.1 competence protein ComE [Cyanobacteria bacterium UBA9226]
MTRTSWHLWGILFLTLILSGCKQVKPQITALPPLPQDPLVQVYFNHSQSAHYTESLRKVTRSGDNLEELIVKAIASAKSSLDIAVQELRLPDIAQALVARHQAGVKVRVILDNTYSRPWSDFTAAEVAKLPERERDRYHESIKLIDRNGDGNLTPDEINQGDALVILRNAGIPVIDDTADGSKGSDLMHHKFTIVDGSTLIVTSANFTLSDIHGDLTKPESRGNANNLLKIDSPELATAFTEEFNLMWGDGPGGKPDSKFGIKKPLRSPQEFTLGNHTITVQFSPVSPTQPWSQSSNGLIGKTLSQAKQRVDLALFVFSEQQLADILEVSHEKGVEVRGLIEPSFAYRYYSEGLDMLGVALSNRCKYEANNHPWQNAIATLGIPQLPKGDLLHHKFGIVDRETVITGSHNWSEAANNNNDETLLIIHNPTVAAHFHREFERLYAKSILGIPIKVQEAVKKQETECPQITEAIDKNIPSTGQLINLNTASQAELETLPGVGPKLARAIIATRQEKPFTSLEDIERVPGVGASLQQKLDGRVTW